MKAQQKKSVNYRDYIKNKEVEIVKVTVPSGFVFEFKKPGVFGTLFGIGSLPQNASSGAVEKWVEKGLFEIGDDPGQMSPDVAEYLNVSMAVVDRVISLSHKPKLVSGVAKNDGELSTDDVDEEDLAFLFKWVSAGGDLSAMLGKFPSRPKPDTLASANRPKQRDTPEPISGN